MTPPTPVRISDAHRIVARATADDDLFIRMDRAFGLPLANQVVWKFRTPVTADEFATLTDRLRQAPFNRTLRRSRAPFVRDYWLPAGLTGGITEYESATLDDAAIGEWLDQCAADRFDLTTGPVWSMRATRLSSGAGLVVLTSSHAVSDGWSGVRSVLGCFGDKAHTYATFPAREPRPIEDIADGVRQLADIAKNLGMLVVDTVRSSGSSHAVDTPITSTTMARPVEPSAAELAQEAAAPTPLAVVCFDSAEWKAAADRHDGTSNALFVAIVTALTVAAGRADWNDAVSVTIPMSMRSGADVDYRANVTTGVELAVPAALSRERDLAAIRARARDVYGDAPGTPSALARLAPLAQSLSDGVVARLNKSAATPLAVASNVGVLPADFAGLGRPERVHKVMLRSTPQHVSRERLLRLRGGLAAWLNDSGSVVTLSVGGFDPRAFPSSEALYKALSDECLRWGLTPTPW